MPWNGSGTFSRTNGVNTGSTTWQQDRDAGTKILASRHDTHDQDLGDGINNALAKDGQNAATGDIDFDGNSLILDADGDTSIGSTTDDRVDFTIGGTVLVRFGHDSTNSSAFALFAPTAITAQANTNFAHLNIAPAAAVTIPTGTTAVVASLEINEPNITATGTVTAAATLYISGAPTEGGSNYALWVDSGAAQFDGDVDIDGNLTLANALPVAQGGTGATDGATALTNLGAEAADADILKADTADVLTAGYAATPYSAGTQTSGTFTPDESNGNLQYAVNGGAHTLAPPSNSGTLIIQYTNNVSAGAITTSGFTTVTGDSFDTTDGNDFLAYITKNNGFSHLHITALQ